jgi:prolyl-tRNA editing enzyme YbaK/EbsC (Cys-tRNA(Pro) deacylase)
MSGPDDHLDPKVARVVAAGRGVGLHIEPRAFSGQTRTAEDAAREVGCEVGQIVKSLVFDAGGNTVLLLVSGSNRVDVAKATAVLGVETLDKADALTAKAATGFSIGSTPPVGLATELAVLMDEDLLKHSTVWAAAGRPDTVFEVDPSALAHATRATLCDLRVASDT